MSEEENAGNGSNNSIPLAEPEDSTVLININERTERSSSGEPLTDIDSCNQAESTRVRKFRDNLKKWEDIGRKTYAEAACALPGGSPEGYGNPSQVHTACTQEPQSYDQNLQGNVKNPSQTDQQQGLHSLQGTSNQALDHCQGSHPPALTEHASQEQQLQGSHLEGSALQGHFSQVCQLLSLHCDIY